MKEFSQTLRDMSHQQLGAVARRLEEELGFLQAEVEGRPQGLSLVVERDPFPLGPWKIRVQRVVVEEF